MPRQKQSNPKPLKQQQAEVKQLLRKTRGKSNTGSKNSQKPLHWKLLTKEHFEKKIKLRSKFAPKKKSTGGERVAKKSQQKNSKKDELVENQLDLNIKDVGLTVGQQSSPVFKDKYDFIKERARMARSGKQEPHTDVTEGDTVVASSSKLITSNPSKSMNLGAEISLKTGRGSNTSVNQEKQNYRDEQQAIEALLQIKSVDLQAINNNNPVITSNHYNNTKPQVAFHQKGEHIESQGKHGLTSRDTAMNQSPLIFHTSKYQDISPGNVARNMTVDVEVESPLDTRQSKKIGRHICEYCGHRCAKPSVLTKHLRSHTGERPYPCKPCGFAFKTKSNLYKHCKSHAHSVKVGIMFNDSPLKGSNGEEDSEETESEDETKHSQREEDVVRNHQHPVLVDTESSHTSHNLTITPSSKAGVVSESCTIAFKGHVPHTPKKDLTKLTEHSISKLLKGNEQVNNFPQTQDPGIAGYKANMESKEPSPIESSSPKGSASGNVDSDKILIPLSNFNIVKTKGQYHLQLPMGTLPPEALASIQSRAKDSAGDATSGNKEIKERIQKLISDNEEIIDNSDLESVKPRKLGFDFKEGEFLSEDDVAKLKSETERSDTKDRIEQTAASAVITSVAQHSNSPESNKSIKHISLQHTRQLGSAFEIPHSHKKPLVPGPLNLSSSGFQTAEGVSVKKRKAASETRETVEEGMVFFSKKMKKTLYMPPDASSKKVSIESPQPAILSNLLTAPKVTQGQKGSMSNSMMFSSSLKKIASPFSAHGSSEMALGSPASSVGLATSSCVPVIQHTPKSDSSSFSFTSDPNKRELSSNQQGLLRISTNAEQWGDTSDSQASLMRPSSLNLGVRTVNSSYISKSERRRLSNKLIPTPKSGTSPKSLSSPRDGNIIHGVGSSDVPSIQLASPRVRGSLPTPDLAWKKGAEKSPFQSLNIDVASPLAKMIKFPPVGSGGKPIIDPRVLLSPEALSIAESVMKKASPTNAKTPSTPVEQARELGRLVAHAFHNAGGNIDSVLSTSDGNLIVGPIATPTSTGAKSQIFILPSPSSTQAPSFPGMSPSTPSKPFTPTGSGQVPFALSGPPPKVKTPTGVPMKALTPTGPGKGFSLGFGQSKPLTPVASKIFPTAVGPSSSVIPSPATPGKMASSFMQFPSKISSPHPVSLRSMTPTTAALQKSVPTVKPVPYSSSCNVALTFSGSTTKVKSLATGNAKPNLTGLKSLPVTPGNQSLAVLTPGIANRGSGASSPTHPVALKLTVPSSQAGGLSEAPMNLSMSASSAADDTKQSSQSHALERKSSEDIKSYSQNFSNNMLTKGKRKLLGLVKNEQGQTLPTVPIFLYANMSARMCGVTQVTNCCSKRLQPMYAVQGGNSKVSMYSNWRSARHVEHPLGISWKIHLGLYNSHRNRKSKVCYSQCNFTPGGIYTESKNMKKTKVRKKERNSSTNKESRQHHRRVEEGSGTDAVKDENEGKSQPTNTVGTSDVPNVELSRIPLFPGGYESHEDYVYVRGRGRGKYVCMECGIRCKKPSMLKKHIRTHTDVRPYQCKGCSFSFKTKGNLTKHMKSKAHVKKCLELGLPPGDVDLDSATDDVCDMEDGEDNQFADVDSEDTDSICSDISEEEEEMDSEDSARETPSSIVEAPYGVKTSNQITRVGSCTTSVAAVTDRELPPTLKALHDRMGLKRSLSEAQLTPLSAKNDSEKDPAREQRLDELMGALKNRTMPPLNKPSRSEVVCKLTQHLTNKQQRNSTDGKLLPSPMKRSMSVNNLPIASHSLLRPSPSLPMVRPALNDGSKQDRALQGYQENEVSLDSATKSAAISSDLVTSAMITTPTMSKKSILTRRFEQKEGKDSNLERLHIAPIAVSSHMQIKSGNLSKESMKLDVSSRDARNSLDTRNSLLVPPPIIEPISDDEDEEKDKKARSAEVKLEQSKIIPGSQRFVSSVPDTSNAIKTLLLTRAPVWPFPMEGIPCSPYSPRFIPPSPSLLNAAPSPNLLMPYSPISGRPPLVSPMSPSKLSQLPPTVLSRVHSPSPLARTSPHFRLEHTLRADNNQTLSVKKETPVTQNVQVPTSSTLLKNAEFEMPANVSTSTPVSSGEATTEEEQSIPIPSTTGPHKCSVCGKGFMKPNQLRIHIREHSLEKYYTCFDCCLHFPTKSLLSKHERTEQHFAKVEAVEIATVGTDPEPRPFKCKECAIAFRIPGHLAKHLRSRGHLMTLERSGKLPPHKEQLLRAELGQDDRDDALSPESSERTDSASEAEDDTEFRRGT